MNNIKVLASETVEAAIKRAATYVPDPVALKRNAMHWFAPLQNVTFESWSDELRALSFVAHSVSLDNAIILMILDVECKFSTFAEKSLAFREIVQPIVDSIGSSTGYFIKLTSRSPKDELADFANYSKPRALFSTDDMLIALMNSMRTFEDLCRFAHMPRGCNLWISQYEDFSPSDEWRVFVKDGRINGISQYYYGNDFEYEDKHLVEVEARIRAFILDKIIPLMQIDTFVADVIADGNSITLLETNPYGLSDPCLFSDYASLRDEMLWEVH